MKSAKEAPDPVSFVIMSSSGTWQLAVIEMKSRSLVNYTKSLMGYIGSRTNGPGAIPRPISIGSWLRLLTGISILELVKAGAIP